MLLVLLPLMPMPQINADISQNHGVYQFGQEWSCFEDQTDVKRMVRSYLLVAV
jgi:hypothetical protein